MAKVSKAFVFTFQNVPNEVSDINAYFKPEAKVKYAVWQHEKGEETGKEHVQMYGMFEKAHRYTAFQRLCGDLHPHVEVREGTHEQAEKYCSKLDTRIAGPWTHGKAAGQGHRSDLDRAVELIKQGASDKELAEEVPTSYIRFYKGFKALKMAIHPPPYRPNVQVYVLYGDAGAGKSSTAFNAFPDAYRKTDGDWWDGYDGQETVVFDDFYGSLKWSELLKVLDPYPMRVQVKGSHADLRATRFIITSNEHPANWYKVINNLSPLKRRINKIYKFEGSVKDGTQICYEEEWEEGAQAFREGTYVRTQAGIAPQAIFLPPEPTQPPADVGDEDGFAEHLEHIVQQRDYQR